MQVVGSIKINASVKDVCCSPGNERVFFGQFFISAGSSDLLRFLSVGFMANPRLPSARRKVASP